MRISLLILLILCASALNLIAAPLQQAGTASWYGEEYRGRPMANGAPFNPDALTCASWFYPLGTVLEVRSGRRRVSVTVTDRGPRRDLVDRGILIDLSRRAFEQLGQPSLGHLAVTIQKSANNKITNEPPSAV